VFKFVKDNYERTGNNKDFIVLKDIKMVYQSHKEYEQTKLKTLKESLEKVFNSNFIDDKKINGKKYSSVMMGWRLKIEEDESDDDWDESEDDESAVDENDVVHTDDDDSESEFAQMIDGVVS
jgi:hypothetical protein